MPRATTRSLPFLHRRARTSTLAAPSTLRTEVCPPSLRQAPDSAWQRALFWLLAPAPHDASPAPGRLRTVRDDFAALVADLPGDDARRLDDRIARASSLRDLWHLRAEAYRVIGVALGQAVAESRLARIDRHFPTRAPRTARAVA